MKKWIIAATIIAILTVASAGGYVVLKPTREIITDDFGSGVTMAKQPERIVSMAPSNTEILFALGLGGKIVGVTEYCNYPAQAKGKEKIGGPATVSIERVVALRPDLVLADNLNGKETVERLESLNLTVIVLNSKNMDETLKNIRFVGEITGEEENASALVANMEMRIEAIKNKTMTVEKTRVTHIVWHEPLWVAGNGTFEHEIIEKAGGGNIFSDTEGWKAVSLETLIERDPEVITVTTGHGAARNETYAYIISDERLKDVDAVKNGRVYLIDADIICRAGPRIVDALEIMAKDIHPELFGGINESCCIMEWG
jgi:iron complex transport system substrate-binding protein